MVTEPLSTQARTGEPDNPRPRPAEPPSDQLETPVGTPPDEQQGAATRVQAADLTGEVRASKEVPEPDSLGG